MNLTDTPWIKGLKDKYYEGISNIFILSGNIGDYAVPGVPFVSYVAGKLNEMNMDEIVQYDIESGLTFLKKQASEEEEAPIETDQWTHMLLEMKKADRNRAFFIMYPDFVVPNVPIAHMSDVMKEMVIGLHKTINSPEFLNSGNMVIFIAESERSINERFINSHARTVPITVPYPNEDERLEMVEHLKKTSEKAFEWEVDEKKLARLTAGLSRVHIEDIFLQAETRGVMEKATIMSRKNELLVKEYGDVIEVMDSEGYSFEDFAGQEQIKAYHREVIIEPMLEGDLDSIPKGVLYSGPPGTGKSHFARCIAGEANATSVMLKINKIMDKWVGESEKKMAKLFMGLTALAPVIVFVDEIDQAFGRGENEANSVTKNIFGMFLQFLSEPSHRGKIIWIGATNYPNNMDEALKRTGRFDKKIPFLPPNKKERMKAFLIYLRKASYSTPITVDELEALADMTEKYTPAEIEGVVVKAIEVAKRKKLKEISFETVKYAIECIITAQNSKIDEMIDIALKECNDREFLPEEYKNRIPS